MKTNAEQPEIREPESSNSVAVGIAATIGLLTFSAVSVLVTWLVWTNLLGRQAGNIDGKTLVSTIYPLPFISFSCVLWLYGVRKYRFADTGGVPLRDDGAVDRLGTSLFDPLWAAVVALGFASFAMSFVVALLLDRLSLPVAILILLVVVGSGVAVAAYSIRRVASGVGDVVVDRICEVLILPANGDRTERLTVPWSAITDVKVELCNRPTDWSRGFRGGPGVTVGGANFLYHAPVVVVSNGNGGVEFEERVFRWMHEPEAYRLADWLRRQLGRSPAR